MFDPIEFAVIAKALPGSLELNKEARTRSAIGRAYYSLFLAVRTAIREAQGAATHGRGDRIKHGGLRNALYSTDSPQLKSLGKLLEELYDARRAADYELQPTGRYEKICNSPDKARRLARRAESAVKRLSEYDFSTVAARNDLQPGA